MLKIFFLKKKFCRAAITIASGTSGGQNGCAALNSR